MTHHTNTVPKSISVIKFSSNHVLFVGDSKGAALFAYELGGEPAAVDSRAFSVRQIDQRIADLLGVSVDQIGVRDLAVHPTSKEAYIAVHRGHGSQAIPVIVCVNPDGALRIFDLQAQPHTAVSLPNPAGELELWTHLDARTLSITDLQPVGDELFVSGLSNAEFSSTLYRIPYPFKDEVQASSIEIYHAAHSQTETRAPIQTMTVLALDGKPHVLAAYTCTPLVTIPLDELQAGAHVKGKTIGELGYGSAPIDMLHFHAQDMQGKKTEHVLITHKSRGAMLFDIGALAERNTQEGLSAPAHGAVLGPKFAEVPLAGVIHVDSQDGQFLLTLRRDMDTGRLDLLSYRKGLYYRIGDLVSEFMLPGFPFDKMPQEFRSFYGTLQRDEGL